MANRKIALTRTILLLASAMGAASTCLIAAPAAAQTAPSPYRIDESKIAGLPDFIDGVLAQQIATREVAGAVVTVVYKGRVIFTRGYGWADVERQIPVNGETTLFRPGSVSKLITWAALMQQIEAGKIDLDADVNRYLDFRIPPFEGKPIKVRDLFAHAVGMSDLAYDPVEWAKPYEYQQFLKTNIPQRLWPAGGEISYSNYGASLAGYLVERVAKQPFPDYVEARIFKPLGMAHTVFREPLEGENAANMAMGYALKDGQFVARPYERYGKILPAGSAASTAPDMARFALAMLGGGAIGDARILKPESVRFLMSDSVRNAPNLPGMAHGFMVARPAGPRIVGHGGNTADFHSYLAVAPEAEFGFYTSYTGGGSGSYGARTELSDAIIGRMFPQTPAARWTGDAPLPPMGAYRVNRRNYAKPADPAGDITVSAQGSGLMLERQGSKSYWERIGPNMYQQVTAARVGGPYDRIEFYAVGGQKKLSFAAQPHVTYHLVATPTEK